MKRTMNNLWRGVKGWNGFLLSFYCYLIFFGIDYQLFYHVNFRAAMIIAAIFIVPIFIICPFLMEKKADFSIKHRASSIKLDWHFFLFFSATLIAFLFCFGAFFPGGFNPDSLDQLSQALRGEYNDWHPFLHTLFAYTLPLTISGKAIWSIALFQLLCFSAAVAYMGVTFIRYGNAAFAYGSISCLLLNPVICGASIYAVKDTFTGIFVILCLTFVLHIYYTNGSWLNSRVNILKYSLTLIAVTFFRHNTILFTLPLFLVSLLFVPWKQRIRCSFIFVCLAIIVKIILPFLLHVEKPGKRQIETLGLPLTVLCDLYQYDREALTEDAQEFISELVPEENWEYYRRSNFNSIKWTGIHADLIEKTGTREILKMFFRTCVTSPRLVLLLIMNLTEIVWQPFTDSDALKPYIEENAFGIQWSGIVSLRNTYDTYYKYYLDHFSALFVSIGSMNLFVIAATLCKCDLREKGQRRKALITLPLLLYNFGTMLLLTGPDYRFFFFSLLAVPIYLLLMFSDYRKEDR